MGSACSCPENVLRAIKSDIDRCAYSLLGDSKRQAGALARVFLLFPGLWAVIIYRLAHHFYYKFRPHAIGRVLYAPMHVISYLAGIALGVEIIPHAHIGAGFFVNHFGGIHLGAATIGENCNISHGVTIGSSGRTADPALVTSSPVSDLPTLGDRVWVGPGATIAGPVTVGHDSVVAANSLVTRDVPPYSVMLGVPAAAVSSRGSFTQISFRAMAADPGRAAALAARPAARRDDSLRRR